MSVGNPRSYPRTAMIRSQVETTGSATGDAVARGTVTFWRTNAALFIAGFATFTLLYCVQPLLPLFSQTFGLQPAQASLALSIATLTLAAGMLVAGPLSETWGRKGIMAGSLALAGIFNVLAAASRNYAELLALRALEGLALSGLPAVAMAYLGEEIDASSLGFAMGLYVAGTAVGGMAGRLATGLIADAHGWRAALGVTGVLGVVVSLAFARILPASANFRAQPLNWRISVAAYRTHLADAGLPRLYAVGFLAMGAFVTIYNYLAFRLLASPYVMSESTVGAVFVVYLVGIFASAWMGRLADRYGRRRLLWIAVVIELTGALVTLATPLPLVVAGIALLTFGFFATHSLVSSWVGRRAVSGRAQASSLYLFFYYLGSTVVGTFGGLLYTGGRWDRLVASVAVPLILALVIALRLRDLRPVSTAPSLPMPA